MQTTRRTLLWFGVSILLVVVGAISGRAFFLHKTNNTPVAAYLLPIDNNSRVKLAWWHTKTLRLPLTLHSGEQASLPANATIKVVHTDTGEAEVITGPKKLILQQKLPSEPEALISPLTEIVTTAKTVVPKLTGNFTLTSPAGITRYLNPLITWTAREGILYDVAVLDPADPLVPPRVAEKIRPPVALADLATPQRRQLGADRNYEVVVRETGATNVIGGARFLTSPSAQLENQLPTTPVDLIAEATAAMAKKPYRTGDAWLALSHLPADWAKSELGVRLRLRVAADLGLADELAHALEDAKRLR
jgi:hypothetical protein